MKTTEPARKPAHSFVPTPRNTFCAVCGKPRSTHQWEYAVVDGKPGRVAVEEKSK